MGLAGSKDSSTPQGARLCATHVSRAEMYIDRARECKSSPTGSSARSGPWLARLCHRLPCLGFKRVENLDGECAQLMKKAVIAKLRGDEQLAEQWAQNHNRVWEEGTQRIIDSEEGG